jgi:hypothetical protein
MVTSVKSMRRFSLLLAAVCAGCLVQDPAWMPPAETDAEASSSTSGEPTSGEPTATTTSPGDTSSGDTGEPQPPTDALPQDCTPLGELPEDALILAPDDNATLHVQVAAAASGTTIALQPGTYDRAGHPRLDFSTPGVTIRSTTGNPDDVILEGGGEVSSLIKIAADDIHLAEFTLQGSTSALLDIGVADNTLSGLTFYRMVLRDAAGTKLDAGGNAERWTDDGVVACSTFEQTDTLRDSLSDCSNVSAIRISGGKDWVIRDNVIDGHWCTTPTHAVLVADRGSRDTLIQRNVFSNNFRGILLGGDTVDAGRPLPDGDPCGEPLAAVWGHARGLIVNNVIRVDDRRMAGAIDDYSTDLDSMLGFWHVCAGAAVHNTSYVELTTFNGFEWRYSDTSVTIANNLLSTTLDERDMGLAYGLDTNQTGVSAEAYADPASGDLRLSEGSPARDAGLTIPGIPVLFDFDGQPRQGRPDLGAFESQP